MNIQRTKTYIREISLTWSLTIIIIFLIVPTSMSICTNDIIIRGKLILWIEYFISVHYWRWSIKILYRLIIFTCIEIHNCSIKEIILLIENILFVIVSIFVFLFWLIVTKQSRIVTCSSPTTNITLFFQFLYFIKSI